MPDREIDLTAEMDAAEDIVMGRKTHPPVHVTTDGDTLWLKCFAGDPDADDGEIIRSVEPGDSWWELAGAVDRHITGARMLAGGLREPCCCGNEECTR